MSTTSPDMPGRLDIEERLKPNAEVVKPDRDRVTVSWMTVAAVFGGVVTLGTLLLRAPGVLS